jgi:hypothetical protein
MSLTFFLLQHGQAPPAWVKLDAWRRQDDTSHESRSTSAVVVIDLKVEDMDIIDIFEKK